MKRLLQLGFLLGFGLTAAAAWLLPGLGYDRQPSLTTMVANGGRTEEFLIHLPHDRLQPPNVAAGGNAAGAVSFTEAGNDAGDDETTDAATSIEHFKLRDGNGNVIGVAARHATSVTGREAVAWLLSVPSRGSIAFGGYAAPGPGPEAIAAGAGGASLPAPGNEAVSRRAEGLASVHSTGEFERVDINLDETWVLAGLDEDGAVQGTIMLDTVSRRSQ